MHGGGETAALPENTAKENAERSSTREPACPNRHDAAREQGPLSIRLVRLRVLSRFSRAVHADERITMTRPAASGEVLCRRVSCCCLRSSTAKQTTASVRQEPRVVADPDDGVSLCSTGYTCAARLPRNSRTSGTAACVRTRLAIASIRWWRRVEASPAMVS